MHYIKYLLFVAWLVFTLLLHGHDPPPPHPPPPWTMMTRKWDFEFLKWNVTVCKSFRVRSQWCSGEHCHLTACLVFEPAGRCQPCDRLSTCPQFTKVCLMSAWIASGPCGSIWKSEPVFRPKKRNILADFKLFCNLFKWHINMVAIIKMQLHWEWDTNCSSCCCLLGWDTQSTWLGFRH